MPNITTKLKKNLMLGCSTSALHANITEKRTPTDYILKQKWCIEKDKFPKAVCLLKVSHMDTTQGLLKVIQSDCFCVPIDNFKQVSQITVMCLLQTLGNFCMQNIPFYSPLFL